MPPLSSFVAFLALCAAGASALAWRNVKRPPEERRWLPAQHALTALVAAGALAACLVRWKMQDSWRPLSTHLDAFLLMDAIFAAALLFVQMRPRLYGVSAFGNPLLALLLVWALCPTVVATPFQGKAGEGAWLAIHLAAVLGGLALAAVGAVAGSMYLFVQRRLKDKAHLGGALNLISLETLEDWLIRSATLSFALFSAGLATGVVLQIHRGSGSAWLLSPKVLLAAVAWVMYALLMNVRYASAFRGKRAAWLAIVGLTLVMAVYGITLAAAGRQQAHEAAPDAQVAPAAAGGRP